MTDPDQQSTTDQPPAAPAKKSRLGLVLGGIALLLAVIGGTVATTIALQSDGKPAAAPKPLSAWDREQQQDLAGEVLPDPTETAATPDGHIVTASDMTLKTKITSKKCFGSTGCNLTVQVVAERKADVPLPDPGTTWLVTYEITGVDDSPVIGSFEITDGEYTVNEEALGTKNAKSKVKIRITGVEKVGI